MKRLLFSLILLLASTQAFAQVADQGQPATTSNAAAWPFKVVFGDAQIDPRDVSDRVGRALGKITFDGAQPVSNDVLTDVWNVVSHAIATTPIGTQSVITVGTENSGSWTPAGAPEAGPTLVLQHTQGVATIFLSGTFVGTIVARGNASTTDVTVQALNLTDGTGPTTNLSLNKLYAINVGGFQYLTLAVLAYTSGTIDYEMGAGPGSINMAMGTQAISAVALPLPNGASTAAKQDSLLTELQLKADLTETQPVSLASIPINAAAATAANQTTGNGSLGSIKTNTDPLVASGAGGYVRQDSTATIAKETGGNLAAIKADVDKIPSQGQALAAASMPVVLTAAQLATLAAAASQTNGTQKTQLIDALAHVGVITTNGSLRVTSVENDAFQQIQANTTNELAELQVIDANQSNGNQLTRVRGLTGGELTIAGASTAALATESSAIVQESPNSFLNTFIAPGGGGYVRQDSTATIAKETGGNLDTLKTNTDPFKVSFAGGYVRQDSTGTIAKETGGNLAGVKTNTDPLVAAAAGGYVRQDSTGTIAKETGGNLAGVKTNTDKLDIALSALRDALAGAAPNAKTLQDLYTLLNTLHTDISQSVVLIGGVTPSVAPTQVYSPSVLPFAPCNAVRRTYCTPKGY